MEEINLKTTDGINICANHYKNGHDGVVIIAPGWCMTKDSKAFCEISENFAQNFDVLTLDFRGHGKSGGWYTFTAMEGEDLQSVVDFAKSFGYKKIYLAGFSLGGAIVLNYAGQNNDIDRVIAVSAPVSFSKIENMMWRKEAWLETLKKFELMRFLSIRPCPIPLKKTITLDIVPSVKAPTLFIAGDKDPTVRAWHTKKLFENATCEKDFKLFENGIHAEDLFLYYKEEFMKLCNNWFGVV